MLVWGNQRKLADRVTIDGTFYGGDLDILSAPAPDVETGDFAVTDDDKREAGGNVWLYLGGFSFFGQYVDQKLAGLPRTGLEGEVAWRFDLPLVWAVRGRQLFPSIAPSVRYSKLDNSFRNPAADAEPELRLGLGEDRRRPAPGPLSPASTSPSSTPTTASSWPTARSRKNNEFLTTLRGGSEDGGDELQAFRGLAVCLAPRWSSPPPPADDLHGHIQLLAKGGKGPARGSDVRQAVVYFEPASPRPVKPRREAVRDGHPAQGVRCRACW